MSESFSFIDLDYGLALMPVSEAVEPRQEAPALVTDRVESRAVWLGFAQPPAELAPIAVERGTEGLLVRNGQRAVWLPADGLVDPPYPGPIRRWSLNGREFTGASELVDAPGRGRVDTVVESIGPCLVQWRTVYRWGNDGRLDFRARWAAGADTIQIVETISRETGAAVEWRPFGEAVATAWIRGGGEGTGPMQPAVWKATPGSVRTPGRRVVERLAHVSYFNQWCQAWAGFTVGDGRLAGVFTGWGGLWQRRGQVRPELVADDTRGFSMRFPVTAGRRCWGLVLAHADPADPARTILNTRKLQLADLAPAKVRHWQLAASLPPRQPRLLPEPLPEELPLRPPEVLLETAGKSVETARLGGYEGVIIFDGRKAKSIAFDVDARWALGLLDESQARRLQEAFLLLAYIFADPDYCTYGDFRPDREPGEGIAEALRDEMGDCPVPPNFASEYFSTVGVVAELYPDHPEAVAWRAWAIERTGEFLDTWFAPDGTYRESINYHTHAVSELLCFFYPLWRQGRHDFFAHPAIKGSFEHFAQLQMPPLAVEGKAPLPANGNSGGGGRQQIYRGELIVGAAVYRESEPELAAHLMHAWQTGGQPVDDHEHPVLTRALLPACPAPSPSPWQSVHRQGLGIVSKASAADGGPIWALFRAGKTTHHMDFDQGHLHLAAWDRELLGDHGYHTRDSDGSAMHAAATWLHSTLTYGGDRQLSSGYTGLERAPEPLLVHLGEAFDWCVHRIVNHNYRHLGQLSYRDLIQAPATVHLRHYLFAKPDYFLVWDVLERQDGPGVAWWHSPAPWEALGGGRYRAGAPGEPHLALTFLGQPEPVVVENRQVGPYHALGVQVPDSHRLLTLLVPQRAERHLAAEWHGEALIVRGDGVNDRVQLPPPGTTQALPSLARVWT